MKRIITSIAILLAAAFAFSSCDKFEEDDYLVFSGSTGTWYDSQKDIPDTQRAFLEKYTGVSCKNCPKADEIIHAAMEKYGDLLNVASVHYSDFAIPLRASDPDLRTEKGNVWGENFVGTSPSLPAALINRQSSGSAWDIFNPGAGFDDRIDAAIANPAPLGILMEAGQSESGFYADVHLQFFETIAEPLTLTVLVIEDDIHTAQISGKEQLDDYQQNHVMREIVTDAWGMDVDADGIAGTKRMVRLDFQLPAQCKPANCKLIAFASYKGSKLIVNSDQCNITLP